MENIYIRDLEYSLIGAICIEQRVIKKIRSKLDPDDFTIEACAKVYEAAVDAVEKGKPFDPVIAVDVLQKNMNPQNAKEFIVQCGAVTPTCENAVYHAELLHKEAGKRRLQNAIDLEFLNSDDPSESASNLIGVCQSFLSTERTERLKPLSKAMTEMYDEKLRRAIRIDTGFPILDNFLKGIWGGNLVIIGARTGVGKTAFALEIARNAAMKGNKVLIYSMEMLADELAERFIARTGSVTMDKLIENNIGKEDWGNIAESSVSLSKLPIYINDEPNVTTGKIRSQARSIPDLKLIIVDFITLMSASKKYDTRNLEVGAISRELKNLASDLQIPIIVLSQINRGVDDNEKPELRGLRDSGELEQNSNKVLLLWNMEPAHDGLPAKVGVYVAKNRRGQTGTVVMNFYGDHMRFVETQESFSPSQRRNPVFSIFTDNN